MSRIYSLYLADIIECCERIQSYTSGKTFDEFIIDNMMVDAVVRNLEIIGEAVKNLPDNVRCLKPEIEWKKAARFRDIIAHHYFKVDYDLVWSITKNKIEVMRAATTEMLATLSETEDLD